MHGSTEHGARSYEARSTEHGARTELRSTEHLKHRSYKARTERGATELRSMEHGAAELRSTEHGAWSNGVTELLVARSTVHGAVELLRRCLSNYLHSYTLYRSMVIIHYLHIHSLEITINIYIRMLLLELF